MNKDPFVVGDTYFHHARLHQEFDPIWQTLAVNSLRTSMRAFWKSFQAVRLFSIWGIWRSTRGIPDSGSRGWSPCSGRSAFRRS